MSDYLVRNLKIDIDDPLEKLHALCAKKLRISQSDLDLTIIKESLDARKNRQAQFVYQVQARVPRVLPGRLLKDPDISLFDEKPYIYPHLEGTLQDRPIVVGFGPAGMLAGLVLAKAGARPLIIEQGNPVHERTRDVEALWKDRRLNPGSNVQFGEGGAGTFSDGKLTSRSKDPRLRTVLEVFAQMGAPDVIQFAQKPHIGTDILRDVVVRIREEIKALGGQVSFGLRMEDLEIKEGRVAGILTSQGLIRSSHVLLGLGHSARQTFYALDKSGVTMSPKPFAMGFRIEHAQAHIDRAQYGDLAGHPRLGAASYQLNVKMEEKSAYTFCMCPGGRVVLAASEPGRLVTNGMSYHARNLPNANSALLVNVGPEDYGQGLFAGLEFQRLIEERTFELGGSSWDAPVQRVRDFLEATPSKSLGDLVPSYAPGVRLADLSAIYPPKITQALREGLSLMEDRLTGFTGSDALLTGSETRSSSPVRIDRGSDLQSLSVRGLYPIGEGAGYAGGIMSAAIDGIKAAEAVICHMNGA